MQRPHLYVLIVLFATILAGCGVNSSAENNSPIKIGFFGPLSGPSASDGINARNAAQLAIDNANAANPVRLFELVSYDDQLDSDKTVEIINKLINEDKVQAVISGSYSAPSRVAAPLLQQAGIPMLTAYAVHPEITQAGDMIFRMIYTGPTQGKAMALFSIEQQGHDSFHVIHVDNDYGRSITEGFTEQAALLQASVLSVQSYASDAPNFDSQIATIQDNPADAVILIGYYAKSAEFLTQLREAGLDLPVIGSDGLDSPKLLELAGPHAENVVLATDFSRDDPRPNVQDFIRGYQRAYNTQPDIVASSTYDSVTLLTQAINRSSAVTPQAIRDAIAQTSNFEGVTGIINFTPEREVNKTVLFVQVVRGDFTFLDKLDPSDM